MTKVFVLGASGYIGGSVLVALLKAHPDLDIVALVRHAKDAPKVAALSPSTVTPLLFESGSHEVITSAAADADIVIDMADCDDVSLVRALISGLETRAAAGATSKPVLIHTSGTGVTELGKGGSYVEGKWYDDSSPEDLKAIPATNAHRAVDLEVFAAQARGTILTYNICPSVVYGEGTGPCRKVCRVPEFMVPVALKHGGVPVMGEGSATWTAIHIDDTVDLFLRVFNRALEHSAASPTTIAGMTKATATSDLPLSAFETFYFATAGPPFSWVEYARIINGALIAGGALPASAVEPVHLAPEEFPYVALMGTNTRPLATRASRELGWAPKGAPLSEVLSATVTKLLQKSS